jgi:hypothetical protein
VREKIVLTLTPNGIDVHNGGNGVHNGGIDPVPVRVLICMNLFLYLRTKRAAHAIQVRATALRCVDSNSSDDTPASCTTSGDGVLGNEYHVDTRPELWADGVPTVIALTLLEFDDLMRVRRHPPSLLTSDSPIVVLFEPHYLCSLRTPPSLFSSDSTMR